MIERFETDGGIRIYRIETQVLPHLRGFVNLVFGDGFAPILIDTGCGTPASTSEILDGFTEIAANHEPNFHLTDIQTILLTHAHIDHFGGTNFFRHATGASVACHRYDSRVVASYDERAAVGLMRHRTFLRECGAPEERIEPILLSFGFVPGRTRSTTVDRLLSDGDTIGPATVHHFPGHSAGHIAFEIGNYLVGGDLVLAKTLTQIWPERIMPQTGLVRYNESIDKLRALILARQQEGKQLVLLPGHEEAILTPVRRIAKVEAASKRRNERLLEILRRCDEPLTCMEISRRLYLTSHESRTFFAVCDTAARLEYLQLEGELIAANYDHLDSDPAVRYDVRR